MNVEQRLNTYIREKIDEGVYVDGSLVGVDEPTRTGEFKATVVDTIKYFHIKENGETEPYTYTVTLLKNRNDQGTVVFDERVDELVYINAESLPKDSTNSIDVNKYKTEKTDKIIKNWEEVMLKYPDIIVPEFIKDGLSLRSTDDAELTPEQIILKNKVLEYIKKLNARHRIEVEIGDIYDVVADVSKRVSMLERLVMRLTGDILNVYPMTEPYRVGYGQLVTNYLGAVDTNYFKDRTDLEDPAQLFSRLMERFGKITQILEEEYF